MYDQHRLAGFVAPGVHDHSTRGHLQIERQAADFEVPSAKGDRTGFAGRFAFTHNLGRSGKRRGQFGSVQVQLDLVEIRKNARMN